MRQPPQRRGERLAGEVLLGAGPVAALAVLGVCLLAVLLVPLGLWQPWIVAVSLLPVAAVVWRLARWIPRPTTPVPLWSAVACLVIAVAFAVWAAATHGEHLVLRRDAGSYALYAHWLATRHGLPVDAGLGAFGGPAALRVPGFTLDSPAYYQVLSGSGDATTAIIAPQFLIGAPALYSIGWWLAGWTGLFVAPAVFGGLAVLAAGGLTARLLGARWAPAAAAGLALTQPVLHAGRATFSEPVAMLLVLGAAALSADALGALDTRLARRLALLAGGTLGLAGLVRVDAVREVALLVPLCAVLWVRRHAAAVPMAVSALVGIAVAAVPAVWLARPYLRTVSGSLLPLVAGTVALVLLSVAAVAAHRWWERRRDQAEVRDRGGWWWPGAAAVAVLAVGAVLATRPWWMVAHQSADDPGDALVASLQRQQGLPVDGARTYAERSVEWVVWYTGVPAALAALGALAAAAALGVRWWRTGTVTPPRWLVAAGVGLGSVILTLYRPGITPDHPWADRRLVPVVLPVVAVAATVALAWLVRRAGPRLPRGGVAAVTVVGVLLLLVPAAQATRPVATARTEVGEPHVVADVCAQLQPGDVVVGVDDALGGVRAQNEWVQVVRGVCGRPSAALRLPPGASPELAAASLDRLGVLVRGAGGRLVLLSASEDDGSAQLALAALQLDPRRAVQHRTTEDQHLLVRRPFDRGGLIIDVWLAVWEVRPGG